MACVALMSVGIKAQTEKSVKELSLAGEWNVSLGEASSVKRVTLPGTIDTNHMGLAPDDTTETTHLTRLYAYKGRAAYSREVDIPAQWKKKPIVLFLERTKPAWVYVDGQLVDSCCYISTPHRYVLPQLKPGRHRLDIVVDNSRGVPKQIYASSHAYTEDTQTNWNGIIGKMCLIVGDYDGWDGMQQEGAACALPSRPKKYEGSVKPCFRDFHIEGKRFYADGHPVFLRGKHDAAVWPLTGHVDMTVEGWMRYLGICASYGINHVRFHSWCPPEAAFVAADSLGIYLQPELPFWGSFDEKDSALMSFLHQEGENILREYGHHPSFRMMALGNELWGSIDKMKEFVDDFRKIAADKCYTFGSNYYLGYQGVKDGMDYFTTCRIGGEGWGNYHTHTRGSFSFADAYDGGVINHFHPGSDRNFDAACDNAAVPIISHETGQFQTYPDYREIKKYTGVLRPCNLEMFRRRLAAAGMLSQADDFHKASGLWAVKLYKADIEMDLRTRDMAGFQLLDIQDYPGQGSAYVGILDAFMDSKGVTTPEEWRQWCSPVVPLLVVDRFCFEENDTMRAKVQIANYGGSSLEGKKVVWTLSYAPHAGSVGALQAVAKGEMLVSTDKEGLIDVGEIFHEMHACAESIGGTDVKKEKVAARKYILSLAVDYGSMESCRHFNTYELWVYGTARKDVESLKKRVVLTGDLTADVVKKLEKGANVLWMPTLSKRFIAADDTLSQKDNPTPYTVGGLFQTDYWNYRMFKTICENNKKKVSPGTLGILTNPQHPIFRDFPTEMHTNWQWFPVVKESHPLVLDNFKADVKPIVQVIDNVERNHRLGLVMEWKVGMGKLLVCMSDLEKASSYPEGMAFYDSVLRYMQSAEFNPCVSITVSELLRMLKEEPKKVSMKELDNISQY